VFFSELKYTYIESEAAYQVLALMCDIGGALGLILGSTLLTFCEFAIPSTSQEVGWEEGRPYDDLVRVE